MIIANFINKQDALVTGLDQYDYGQILRIQGLNLPTAVEIHFGLEETGGTTTTRIGVTKDGVTDVPIPDSMLENGDTSLDYTIYAFIYLTDDTSGKTVHRIRMQVKARSKPELLNKPEDKELFQKAIEAVNQSTKEAEGWAHGREDMPERATDNAKYYAGESAKSAESVKGVEQNVKDMVAAIGGIEQQVQDVKKYAGQAKTAAENALLSEQEAKKSEEATLQHRTGAETAENNAELAESNAKKSEQAVEQAKQLVMQMGQQVLQDKNQVAEKVEEFNKAVTDAVDAVGAVKTDAVGAVETAGTEQTKKVADEGTKQVKAVEDKGNEVLQSIPEDFTTQMQSKLDKNQGAENKGKTLVVGEDGNVTVGEVTGGDGIPIINTMSGESPLVVPDSAERVNKGFSLIGKSEQLTTTGKNLFDVTKVMDLKRYEPSSYGYIGFPINVEPGKTYTFNRNKKNGYGLGTKYNCGIKTDINGTIDNWLINNGNEGLNFEKKTIVAKTDKIYFCILETVTDEELSTIIKTCFLNPQLELGNIETTYEPYTGGKPSPSPEYPQEIKSVGKWNPETQKYEVDVKVTGKNLFNKNAAKQGYEFGSAGSVGESTSPKWFVSDFMPVKATTYQISGKKTGAGCKLYNKDKAFVKNIQCPFGGIKFDEGIAYFRINGEIKDLDKIQVEEGGTPTLYEPYKEPQTVKLSLDQPLRGIGEYKDEVTKDGIVRKNKITILDGDESWVSNNHPNMTIINKFQIGIPTINTYYKKLTITDRFRWFSNSLSTLDYVGQYSHGHDFVIQVPKDLCPSLEVFKEWLSKNPTKLCYVLEHPIIEPLPEDFKQAIESLKTYYPTTVVTADGGELNPDIEVSYTADTKNYIDQKIASVVKTVVETQKALL